MRVSLVAIYAALACVVSTPAYAYLDPGTGSMILQGIIGAIAIGAAYISMFWHRVKGFFSRAEGNSPTSDNDAGKN